MSIRWMAVQYVGDMLCLPVVNDGDMDKPFGSSVLERDVKRIVVNPFSDSPQTFVPELENTKLRELVRHLYECMCNIDMDGNYECFSCKYENTDGLCDYERLMRELGVEVDE